MYLFSVYHLASLDYDCVRSNLIFGLSLHWARHCNTDCGLGRGGGGVETKLIVKIWNILDSLIFYLTTPTAKLPSRSSPERSPPVTLKVRLSVAEFFKKSIYRSALWKKTMASEVAWKKKTLIGTKSRSLKYLFDPRRREGGPEAEIFLF